MIEPRGKYERKKTKKQKNKTKQKKKNTEVTFLIT